MRIRSLVFDFPSGLSANKNLLALEIPVSYSRTLPTVTNSKRDVARCPPDPSSRVTGVHCGRLVFVLQQTHLQFPSPNTDRTKSACQGVPIGRACICPPAIHRRKRLLAKPRRSAVTTFQPVGHFNNGPTAVWAILRNLTDIARPRSLIALPDESSHIVVAKFYCPTTNGPNHTAEMNARLAAASHYINPVSA